MSAQAFPLTWPNAWPRTTSPGKSQFKTSLSAAIKNVQDSLRKFADDSGRKVENMLVSSNVTLMDQNPKDAGVAVYFTWDGISTCIAVDRYQRIEENLQAIHHVIEAERTKLRHGGLNLVRAAFRGYAALPPPTKSKDDPWEVLGIKKGAKDGDIEAAYRDKAKRWHPDREGGSHEQMAKLNAARGVAGEGVVIGLAEGLRERAEGLRQIETAQWVKDEYGCLNLRVHTPDGSRVHAWLSLRPPYCDRGHIQLNIDGPLDLDHADSFPRFFFSFREADEHTRTFLKWRLWKERTHPHVLEVA